MKIILQYILIAALIYSCTSSESVDESYPNHVGDIAFDPTLDDPDFKACSELRSKQYYAGGKGLIYDGEKRAILNHFEKNYRIENLPSQNGFVTIRFLVNCERKTGRFRISSMDTDYNEFEFSQEITSQLMKLTKELNGWNFPPPKRRKLDYYQYLTFKIKNGQVTEITP